MALRSTEYVALFGSFVFVGFEALIRVLTLALRTYLLCYAMQCDRPTSTNLLTPSRSEFPRLLVLPSLAEAI